MREGKKLKKRREADFGVVMSVGRAVWLSANDYGDAFRSAHHPSPSLPPASLLSSSASIAMCIYVRMLLTRKLSLVTRCGR